MTRPPQPTKELLEKYERRLHTQGRAENTIKTYITCLRNVPEDVEAYFE